MFPPLVPKAQEQVWFILFPELDKSIEMLKMADVNMWDEEKTTEGKGFGIWWTKYIYIQFFFFFFWGNKHNMDAASYGKGHKLTPRLNLKSTDLFN